MTTEAELRKQFNNVFAHTGPYEDFGTRLRTACREASEWGSKERALFALFAHDFISDERNLMIAMMHLKHKGGHSPGPSGDTQSHFPTKKERFKYCQSCRNELREGTYKPEGYIIVKIPKSSGGHREICLLNLDDRIVLRGIKQVLEPLIEPEFMDCSYGFRPNRSGSQMVGRACEIAIESDRMFWIKADIKNAFPSVPPNAVIELIRQRVDSQPLNDLLWKFMKRRGPAKGLLQGSPLSPFCLNLYLHDRIDRLWATKHPNVPMLRYADDFLILAKTKSQANRALKNLTYLAKSAELELKSTDCSPIYDLRAGDRITTLGMDCSLSDDGTFEIRPAEQSIEKLLDSLKTLDDGDNTVNRIFSKIKGWISQKALAYDEQTATDVISRVVGVLEERQLQDADPQLYDEFGYPESCPSGYWKLGNRVQWLRKWEQQHKQITSKLSLAETA